MTGLNRKQKMKLRLALYVRVSHEEQAKHGYSLSAQKDTLKEWAKANGHTIAGWYIDEGVSARKLVKRRPQMQRMLKDVQAGNIDMIIFIKLDRYFRSVAEYHATQTILEANDTHWKAILEDYDTTTTDGRLKINMMLSFAEAEADRTSDRIIYTNKHKIKKKQPVTGSQPHGYMVETQESGTKRVVKNPNQEDAVAEVFSHFAKYHSVSGTTTYMNLDYGYSISYNTVRKILTNPIYTGNYRGVEDFCPAYITEDQHRENLKIVESKNIPKTRSGNVYIFRGLLICPECGSKLTSQYTMKCGKNYKNYRCSRAHKQRLCSNRLMISELKVEEYLISNIRPEIEKYIAEIEIFGTNKKPKYNRADILAEMERITYSFNKGRMPMDKYDKEYEELEKKLEACDHDDTQVDAEHFKAFLESDVLDIYGTLPDEDKRAAWNSILKEIHVDLERNFTPVFL